MASPRVTQQFVENIRGDTAVIPHGPRVTQQFIESIRSINTGPSVLAASLAETGTAAETVSVSALLAATLAEAVAATDAVLLSGSRFSVSMAEIAGTGGAVDAILFPGGSVFSVAVIEEQAAIDDMLGFPPVDVIGACDGGDAHISVSGQCGADTGVPPEVIVPPVLGSETPPEVGQEMAIQPLAVSYNSVDAYNTDLKNKYAEGYRLRQMVMDTAQQGQTATGLIVAVYEKEIVSRMSVQ